MALSTISFKKGKVFYKGSSKFNGKLILEHHKKVSKNDPCNQQSSIYLGINEKRSLEYFDEKNTWNRFRLIKDIKVLKMNPKEWNKKNVSSLIKRAIKQKPKLKETLSNTENFGGIINLIEQIVGTNIIDILSFITCLIFGIETSVNEQLEMLTEILNQGNNLDLKDKKKYGWTATPTLVKKNTTSLFDYLNHYIKNTKRSNKKNQRLSYFGFDTIFLLLCCYSGFLGYYFPNIKSIHEDAGEELAIFKTNDYIEWIKPTPSFDELYDFSDDNLYKTIKKEAHKSAYELLNELGNLQIVTIESLTGGLISSTFTNLPINGWNKYGSLVVYNSDAKRVFASVKEKNVYSHKCVKEMAIGGLINSNATISLAVSGNAMPYNNKKYFLGELYIGVAAYSKKGTIIHKTKSLNICNETNLINTKCFEWINDSNRQKKNRYTQTKGFASYGNTTLISNILRYKTVELSINFCRDFIQKNKNKIIETPKFIKKNMNEYRTDTYSLKHIPKPKYNRTKKRISLGKINNRIKSRKLKGKTIKRKRK